MKKPITRSCLRRYGTAQGAAYETRDPRPQMHVCALDCLHVLFTHCLFFWINMPPGCPHASVENRVIPHGAHRACNARETISFGRLKTYATMVTRRMRLVPLTTGVFLVQLLVTRPRCWRTANSRPARPTPVDGRDGTGYPDRQKNLPARTS